MTQLISTIDVPLDSYSLFTLTAADGHHIRVVRGSAVLRASEVRFRPFTGTTRSYELVITAKPDQPYELWRTFCEYRQPQFVQVFPDPGGSLLEVRPSTGSAKQWAFFWGDASGRGTPTKLVLSVVPSVRCNLPNLGLLRHGGWPDET